VLPLPCRELQHCQRSVYVGVVGVRLGGGQQVQGFCCGRLWGGKEGLAQAWARGSLCCCCVGTSQKCFSTAVPSGGHPSLLSQLLQQAQVLQHHQHHYEALPSSCSRGPPALHPEVLLM